MELLFFDITGTYILLTEYIICNIIVWLYITKINVYAECSVISRENARVLLLQIITLNVQKIKLNSLTTCRNVYNLKTENYFQYFISNKNIKYKSLYVARLSIEQ